MPTIDRHPGLSFSENFLLVSGPGLGGLLVVDLITGDCEQLDDRPSTGLAISEDYVFRGVQRSDCIEIWQMDLKGPIKVHLLPDARDLHDIMENKGELFIASTGTNEILRLPLDGSPLLRHKFPGDGDAWHINCFDFWHGALVFSAFSQLESHEEYKKCSFSSGFVMDLTTGEMLIRNLSQPHTPKYYQGRYFVCSSAEGSIIQYRRAASTGLDASPLGLSSNSLVEVNRADFQTYTRGMAFLDDHLFLGLSYRRHAPAIQDRALIVALNISDLSVLRTYELPTREIYNISVVSKDTISMLRRSVALANARRTGIDEIRVLRKDARQVDRFVRKSLQELAQHREQARSLRSKLRLAERQKELLQKQLKASAGQASSPSGQKVESLKED